jgi:hypothetical protein
MSDLVSPTDIERIVGAERRTFLHVGRAVSSEQTVYILHSKGCLDSGIDLRECRFSTALDEGIDLELWANFEDVPVVLRIRDDRLVPLGKLDQIRTVSKERKP